MKVPFGVTGPSNVINNDVFLTSVLPFFSVIDGLDNLKKEQQGARDAIRYLEAEFKKSNRLVVWSCPILSCGLEYAAAEMLHHREGTREKNVVISERL